MLKWLLGLMVVVMLTIIFLPMRLVVPQVAPDLTAAEISGTIWKGRLQGAEWRGAALGDLDVGLDARELLAGRLRLDFVRNGVSGLRGRLGTSGNVHIVDALDGPVSLDLPFPFKPRLEVEFAGASLQLDNAGKCRSAAGKITARLSNIPAIGTTPPMSGSFACDEDALFLPLATGDGQLGMAVHVWADRRYRADLIVASRNIPVQLALAAAGFTAGPDGSTLRIEGAF